MWIDKSSTVQELPKYFTETLNDNGWDTAVKFRIRDGQKYADVRLFEAYGTDYEKRRLGMAFGYDTSQTKFNDNRVISDTSPLGLIGMADGTNRFFDLKVFPVDTLYDVNVYLNGVRVSNNRFKLDYKTGRLEFLVAPEVGQLVTISYRLANDAPEPPSFLVFFTYASVSLSSDKITDAPIKLADGDGVKTVYATPSAPIKASTLFVWNDSVPQIEGTDYTVDLTTGEITFTTPPALGKELTVKYTQVIAGAVTAQIGTGDSATTVFYTPVAPIASNNFKVFVDNTEIPSSSYTVDYNKGEIAFSTAPEQGKKVVAKYVDLTGGPATGQVVIEDMVASKTFDPSTPLGTMEAVYRALDFINPSLPTVLSFSESGLGTAWQRDSSIYHWGNITKNSAFLWTRADAGVNALDAFYSPLYFGRILATHKKPARNMCLFAGAATSQEIKWKKELKIGGRNVDYGANTSNGNSSVQMAQTIGGGYYQKHLLAFMTYSKDVDNGEGWFNPSQYLKVNDGGIEKPAYVHSRIRVVHSNDGYSYELDNCYAMHPKKVAQKDKMRVRELGEWETIGFGDGYRVNFILSRNKHKDSALILQVDCVEIPDTDYTYDEETKTVTFKAPIPNGVEVIAFYGYKQEYQYNLTTAPRCPLVLPEIVPYAPIGILNYRAELDE